MDTDAYLLEIANDTMSRVWVQARAIFGGKYIGKAPIILINGRLRTTCGRAFIEQGKMDLSRKLFLEYTPGFIREIIPHEAAHFIAWRRFQDAGHGADWKKVMRALGKEPRLWYPFDKPEDKA